MPMERWLCENQSCRFFELIYKFLFELICKILFDKFSEKRVVIGDKSCEKENLKY